MRAFAGWVVMVLVSVGLGLALYSTSLKGTTTGYQEAAFTPMPTETVVKTKTKVVRKPAKTKVVYVEKAPAPAATVYVPQQSTTGSSAVSRSHSTTSGSSEDSHRAESDDD